jgi:glucose/arabinose dehydrogenase
MKYRKFGQLRQISWVMAAALVGVGVSQQAWAQDSLSSGAPTTTFDMNDTWQEGLGGLTSMRFLPDGRALIGTKNGQLHVRNSDGTTKQAYDFPADTASEKGLLGIAIQPDFATSKRVVIYWSRNSSAGGTNNNRHRVASYVLKADDTLDFASEIILAENLMGPANHDGGGLAFGPDGNLYIGTGDTGCNETPPTPPTLHNNLLGTAFNVGNGKVLRVKIDGTVPADNPWVGATNVSGVKVPYSCGSQADLTMESQARPDIYANGFRNAFRLWADPKTGDVWVGDVGESTYEEINIVEKGKHYGWPFIEGPVTNNSWPASKCSSLSPNPGDCQPAAYTCRHGGGDNNFDGGCGSITGGVIVDSCKVPASFRGKYFFGDNGTGKVWTLDVAPDRHSVVKGSRKDFASINGSPVEFVEGPDGAIYIVVIGGPGGGHVSRVVAKQPANDPTCMNTGGSGGSSGSAGSSGGQSQGGSAGSTTGGSAGGTAGTSTSGTAGSSSAAPASSSDDSGCGCRLVAGQSSESSHFPSRKAQLAGLLAMLGIGLVRRRRR